MSACWGPKTCGRTPGQPGRPPSEPGPAASSQAQGIAGGPGGGADPRRRETWDPGHVKNQVADEEPSAEGRIARLLKAAERRHVPLLTIVTTVAIVAATYMAGKLIYRLRDIVLLILVAGFVAVLLNPIVGVGERRLGPRRGVAVGIVARLAVPVLIGLGAS